MVITEIGKFICGGIHACRRCEIEEYLGGDLQHSVEYCAWHHTQCCVAH